MLALFHSAIRVVTPQLSSHQGPEGNHMTFAIFDLLIFQDTDCVYPPLVTPGCTYTVLFIKLLQVHAAAYVNYIYGMYMLFSVQCSRH